MKFEKQPRRAVYVESEDAYRVTFDPITKPVRAVRDKSHHLLCVSAAVSFWGNADKRKHCLGCARTVKEAWDAGDRYLLDSDKARKGAEIVADISVTRPDDIDIYSALVDLENAIAEVRLSNSSEGDFDILDELSRSITEASSEEGFDSWSPHARRMRIIYGMGRRMRNPIVYTIISLYLDSGATPILTTRQRQEIHSISRAPGMEGDLRYIDDCIRKITEYRFS